MEKAKLLKRLSARKKMLEEYLNRPGSARKSAGGKARKVK